MVQGKISRIMAALLVCSMTGGVLPVSVGAAGEDGSMDPARTELIVNGDFEGGSFEWSINYGGITAEDIVSDPLDVNGSSLYVSERWNAYAAPLYYIDAEPGKTYTLSAEIMYDESEYEEMDFQLLCGVRVEDDTRLGEYLNKTQTVKKGV